MKISKKKFKSIKNTKSISKSEFNDLVDKKENELNFMFEVSTLHISDSKIIFEIKGKHYAKNRINKWHRGTKLKYIKAIKQAFYFFYLKNKNMYNPNFKLSQINYNVFNPKSRDDDANYDSLKAMRDCLTIYDVIYDDSREFLLPSTEEETIDKEYKIIITINQK